jgi:hypothetical protein
MDDELEALDLKSLGIEIFQLFSAVAILPEPRDARNVSALEAISVEAERFKLWAANLGLLVPGHGSLAYRLREAAGLESVISRFLTDLRDTLQEGAALCCYSCRAS